MSQGKNRIAIQTGLFHCWFDQTPIINSKRIVDGNGPNNMFGGYLNDSWGLLFEKEINENSSISIDYMSLKTTFFNGDYTDKKNPFIANKDIRSINVNYNRRIELINKLHFIYGGGLSYIWGNESIFLKNNCYNFGCEPHILTYNRRDLAINLRSGIEYDLLDWLTIYTNFNFLGIVYKDGRYSEKMRKTLKEDYNLTKIPSSLDISWQLGIGINFGK